MKTTKKAPLLGALLGALVLLGALAASPAAAASPSPWWQVLAGARPTNLQPAPDQSEVQEVSTSTVDIKFIGEGLLIAPIFLTGEAVGCLGAGKFSPPFGTGFFGSPAAVCEEQTGFAAAETVETPAELAALLEARYETEVQLAGPEGKGEAPAGFGEGAFTLITPEHWAPLLSFGPPVVVPSPFEPESSFSFGKNASSKVISKDSGRLVLTLTNLGNAPMDATSVPLAIEDELPEGISAYGYQAEAGGQGTAGPVSCEVPSVSHVECGFQGVLPPYEAIEVEVLVALSGPAGAPGKVSVSGGNAPEESIPQTVQVSDQPVPFGIEYFSMRAEDEEGNESSAAAGRPFQLTATIVANSGRQSGAGRRGAKVDQPAMPRNLRFTLPAGMVGSATAVEHCELAVFLVRTPQLTNECPDKSAIGVASVTVIEGGTLGLVRLAVPVFNLPPQRGEPARFGVMVAGVPNVIDTAVDPENSYRVTAEVRNVPQLIQFLSTTTTIWGTPGDESHDDSRGWNCAYFGAGELPGVCEPPVNREDVPFLRMPASCRDRLEYDAGFEPWNTPLGSILERAAWLSEEPLKACNNVPFDPRITASLTSRLAQNPSGLDFELALPNPWPPESSATPEAQPKRIEVTLPEGVTVNPSQAAGLVTCSPQAYARERSDSRPGEGCPQASKIGSIEASSPLISEPIEGSLYVATPYENPSQSLIALYVVARSAERGILVKQPLEVRPDPRTGRLVTIADDAPPLPYDYFRLHFREGGRSPLITPPGCGDFAATARFVPYSAQDPDNPSAEEVVTRSAPLRIDRGVDGGPCPQGRASFDPGFEAGTQNNQAGSYSPFEMRLTRKDGEQDLTRFSAILPPGVLGKLAGVSFCPEAGIARATARTGAHGGQEELDSPSCPAASQIGTTDAGAGVGSQLIYVGGSLYLAGPYKGAPLSVVAITPAVAGPFDAGTVVVREALRLNTVTAEVEADGSSSDPIPHILKGIPLNLRDLRVHVDRPGFTLNATSCDAEAARAEIFGGGTVLAPRPDTPVARSARYQAAGCQSLGFRPKLSLGLEGGTLRGTFPRLRAVYSPRGGDANLSRLALQFPSSEFIEQGHIRTICTRVQFAAGQGKGAQCPKGSVYGHVKAWTPLLDAPLEGPIYLRSSNHNLPDAVLVLHGIVDIEVSVKIDSVHGRLRATVQSAPDAPVSRALVQMQGGQKGLLVNSRNLCSKPGNNRAGVDLSAQNGRRLKTDPPVRAAGCGKRHSAHRRARFSK